MNYLDVTLRSKLYLIDPMDYFIREKSIHGVELLPVYSRNDKLILDKSVFKITTGMRVHHFSLSKTGNIIDDDSLYYFSRQDAEEEIIILKTNQSRLV